MEFDIIAPVGSGMTGDPAWMLALAQHIEACGFGSLVAVEHAVMMTEYDSRYPYDASGRVELAADCAVPDPLDLLAFLAAGTSTLGLATGVLVLPNHHPVVLAKRIATLDALSGGRFRLCVGMGWMREEIEACGTDFQSRGRRANEQIEVLRALWSGEPTSYAGSSSTSATPSVDRRLASARSRSTSAGTPRPQPVEPVGTATDSSPSEWPVLSSSSYVTPWPQRRRTPAGTQLRSNCPWDIWSPG
jgi:alkanesulfonate monooxygenase SsuD/methylene tetrahydromethanopterin reductase-like flavin-dependent oxidoreductase (luciferase family)